MRAITSSVSSGSTAIAGHPDVRRMLMDMKARTEAMRALAYFCAGQMDRAAGHADAQERAQAQALVGLLIPVVKGWCTDSAQGITSDGVQVHGGMGYVEETGASQHMRDARITTIYEGTTGIQANDLIGRKLAREGGVTMKALTRTMSADAHRLSEHPDASLRQLGQGLQRGLDALSQATDWLLLPGVTIRQEVLEQEVPNVGVGYLEALFARLGLAFRVEAQAFPFLHPGVSGRVLVEGEEVGFLGALRTVLLGLPFTLSLHASEYGFLVLLGEIGAFNPNILNLNAVCGRFLVRSLGNHPHDVGSRARNNLQEFMASQFDAQLGIDNVVQPLERPALALKVLIDLQRVRDAPLREIVEQQRLLILRDDILRI